MTRAWRLPYQRLRLLNYVFGWSFSSHNAGYRPDVLEVPHGDGRVDSGKRYAHVAPKYGMPRDVEWLWNLYLESSRELSMRMGVPKQYLPGADSTLRCLRYDAGVGSEAHTDFCLLTLNVWRDCANPGLRGFPFHTGELMTEITGREADEHWVEPLESAQESIVFFAVPDHDAALPSGETVGDWMRERKSRSRQEK